jgi:pimeloyl-ACP methyl ester carboxylesterase
VSAENHGSLAQRADDLEAARTALGDDRIHPLSESAGTRTAMIYSWRHPERIHRSVMIGVNPPGNFLWDPKTTDEQIRRYAGLCSKDDSCHDRTSDLAASMRRTAADIPDRWWLLPINDGNVRGASFYGLTESTSEAAPISAPMTLNSWLSAAEGDASGSGSCRWWPILPSPPRWASGAITPPPRDRTSKPRAITSPPVGRGAIRSLGDPGTAFISGGGRLVDAWPAAPDEGEYCRVRSSKVETLLIGGTLDFATPPQVATRELLPYLPRGHQVVLPELGHTTSFWTYQPDTGSRLITTFSDRGRVDDSLYTPASVDFTPDVTQTGHAKGIAGAMVGLALLTVFSLLWMPRLVHKRGRFGRKASATLRSLYPIVLGLGGWFVGALIVMTTMTGVPLDHELLAVLSVGVPVGLGIYWACRASAWDSPRRQEAPSSVRGWGSTRLRDFLLSSPRSSERPSVETSSSSPSTSHGIDRSVTVSPKPPRTRRWRRAPQPVDAYGARRGKPSRRRLTCNAHRRVASSSPADLGPREESLNHPGRRRRALSTAESSPAPVLRSA